jgi:hypothetical protein
MKRLPLLLILMCLPGAALVAAWAGGRWTVSRWDADLPWIEVPPAEGEGGFADLRYAWADPTPGQRAGRLAGTVRRDTRAGYASDEDWSGEDEGWPWNENAEREREACFALEDEIAAADCLATVDAAVAVAPAPGEAPPSIARPPADHGRPVGTVFGPKTTRPGPPGGDAAGKDDGVDAAIDLDDAATMRAVDDGRASAGRIDLRPTPDDPAGDTQACAPPGARRRPIAWPGSIRPRRGPGWTATRRRWPPRAAAWPRRTGAIRGRSAAASRPGPNWAACCAPPPRCASSMATRPARWPRPARCRCSGEAR